jgi:LPS sulfotransferase NodH
MNEAWQARLGTTSELDSLRKIVARRSSPNGWFGAKVHWAQFEHMRRLSVPDSIFRLRGYVFLSRRDVLAQAISFAIARQTGHWISLDRPKPADPVYRREIVDECVAQIHAEKARWDALRAEIDAPVIELFYEDLVADPQAGVDLIARTFGISGPTAIADIPLTKQADERNDLWRRLYQSGR